MTATIAAEWRGSKAQRIIIALFAWHCAFLDFVGQHRRGHFRQKKKAERILIKPTPAQSKNDLVMKPFHSIRQTLQRLGFGAHLTRLCHHHLLLLSMLIFVKVPLSLAVPTRFP
jgi:hypothetical protein